MTALWKSSVCNKIFVVFALLSVNDIIATRVDRNVGIHLFQEFAVMRQRRRSAASIEYCGTVRRNARLRNSRVPLVTACTQPLGRIRTSILISIRRRAIICRRAGRHQEQLDIRGCCRLLLPVYPAPPRLLCFCHRPWVPVRPPPRPQPRPRLRALPSMHFMPPMRLLVDIYKVTKEIHLWRREIVLFDKMRLCLVL